MSTSGDLMTTLAWSLLHFLWQGAALAALAAVGMALFRESTTRYVIGLSALGLMLVAFVMTFALLSGAPAGETEVAADASLVRAEDAPPSSRFAVPSLEPPPAAEPDLAWIARGWLAVVCLLALRIACGLLLLEHLRRRSLAALPLEIVERCLALQRRLGISRVVRYCECRLVAVPAVIGFVRPIVLLPVRALTGLSAEQLEAVIAHELGHIKRFDAAVNFVQVVVETLFFFHPAVWWLNTRIRADREDCCDDVAIAACGCTADYARALAIMEDWRGTPALSMASTRGDVASRVARLLGMSRQQTVARPAGMLTAALVLAAAVTAGAASIGIARPALTAPALTALQQSVAQVDTLLAQADPEDRSRGRAARAPDDVPRAASYIDEMKAAGFDVTDVDGLIALKMNGVTADYVRELRDAGIDPNSDEVVAMSMHGVTPEYVARLRGAGLAPDADEVIAMSIHGVTPEYVDQVRDAGLVPEADEVIAMMIHGVTPEFVARFRAIDGDLDIDDVIALKIHDVTPELIDDVRSRGFEDLSVEDIIKLKNADVL